MSPSTTVSWTDKKITTYSFTVAANSSIVCPTFLNQSATQKETVTVSNVAGNAKITAGGSFNVCAYVGSDDSVYEASVGTVTI